MIEALAATTVRAIGASQVITSPDSLVKELIDNSLDAKASAIFVEISANTLDLVQVRDNGHGVAPQDRSLVCRRYCTSKIRDLSDLKTIGGTSLGFRGEALTSAAELCASLLITTKIEGEDVADALKIGKDGEIVSQDRASHPIGTTVRLADAFHNLPVRKQSALKASAKCLTRIKHLMQAYALARPAVRLSLRVLKASDDTSNWTYAPKANDSVADAVSKVVGKECAAHCSWHVTAQEGYEAQASIPNPDADPSKICGIGHFLCVDNTPVNSTRGLLKQIMAKFRDKLRATHPKFNGIKEPFAWININCPTASYDANVEPAKDDVLFEDGQKPMAAVEVLLDQCYPGHDDEAPPAVSQSPRTPPRRRHSTSLVREDEDVDVEHLRKRQRLENGSVIVGTGGASVAFDLSETPHRSLLTVDDDEDDENVARGLRDVKVSNPWIMAKMHAKPKRTADPQTSQDTQLLTPLQERIDVCVNSSPNPRRLQGPTFAPWQAPSPRSSPRPAERPSQQLTNLVESNCQSKDPSTSDKTRWTGWQVPGNDFMPAGQLPLVSSNEEYGRLAPTGAMNARRTPRMRNSARERQSHQASNNFMDSGDTFVPDGPNSPPKPVRRPRPGADIRAAFGTCGAARPGRLPAFKPQRPRHIRHNPGAEPIHALDDPAAVHREEGGLAPLTDVFVHPHHPYAAPEETAEVHRQRPETAAHVPLNSIPPGQEMQNILQTLTLSLSTLGSLSASLRHLHTHLGPLIAGQPGHETWREPTRSPDDESYHDLTEDVWESTSASQLTQTQPQSQSPSQSCQPPLSGLGTEHCKGGVAMSTLLRPRVKEAEMEDWCEQLRIYIGHEIGTDNGSGLDLATALREHALVHGARDC